MKRRGITIPWVVFYGILIILLLGIVPGVVETNNHALNVYENPGDPAFYLQSALPFIVFGLLLFRPWKNTEVQ